MRIEGGSLKRLTKKETIHPVDSGGLPPRIEKESIGVH